MSSVALAIETIRRELGADLLIPAHYYQNDAILAHADAVGDSLELSRLVARRKDSRHIVFCGVRFMAETADMLKAPGQVVYMPDSGAGCPMADMATEADAMACARRLDAVWKDWVPVVYVNSSATLKAFCGRRGGSACTSSNAPSVFRWAFHGGRRILFLPDRHLGANTAHDLGLPDEEVRLYDPKVPLGGVSDHDLAGATVLIWRGHCHVHEAFLVDDVRRARARHPKAKIIVHPEACREVVRLSDFHGSTSQLIAYVRQAPDGSVIYVGTERNLVARLAANEGKRLTILPLVVTACPDMVLTTPDALLRVLHHWPAENKVSVPPSVAADARLCLDRMLAL